MNRHALAFGLCVVAAAGVAVACGSNGDEASSFGPGGADAGFGTSGGSSGSSGLAPFADGGATLAAPGVILVHAAAFPAFRVCFEHYGNLVAQPDRKLLPEANVVGVDIGSFVRLGAMNKAPGEIYVIPEYKLSHTPNDPNDPTCADFIAHHVKNTEYFVAGTIADPVGALATEAIVLTGCGSASEVFNLGIAKEECQFGPDEDATGTLKASVHALGTSLMTTEKQWPVELYNASEKLVALAPEGTTVDVSFGDLSQPGRLEQAVGKDFDAFAPNATVTLDLDQSTPTVYGTHGFRIAYRYADGGTADLDAGGFLADQSLAVVQELSLPGTTPRAYFAAPSNYALILLGDPRIQPRLVDGGGIDPAYDPRRSAHIVAIPVRDEVGAPPLGESADAGSDAASDAGTDAATR